MLKKLNCKSRKVTLLVGIVIFCALVGLVLSIFYPYININLVLNMLPFSSNTSNTAPFYGENIDMSQILPASQHYVVNSKGEDLIDIAASLGINLIRITNSQSSFNTNADSLYTAAQWNQVLDKMQSKGIKAVILIETASSNANYYTPNIQPIYLHLVQEYIDSGVFSHPDVYAVDIKNEPLLTDANVNMLQQAHDMIKAKYPALKQTVGWWATDNQAQDPYNPNNYNWSDFSGGKKIANIVDFYSVHMYGLDTNRFAIGLQPDLSTKVFLSQAESGLQTNKPILIEEFGGANGDAVSDQDTIGSPQLQANIYQGVYQALKEMHSGQIMGSVAFDFYSRGQYPDAWAIVKDNGNYLFPAAYILQEYASGKNNPSLQDATVVSSQSYLLDNSSDHTQQNLHLSDRIGFKIQLDNSQNYAISLSAPDILQPLEVFHYDPASASYYAVYQAIHVGSVHLDIVPDPPCTPGAPCTTSAYALAVTVQ